MRKGGIKMGKGSGMKIDNKNFGQLPIHMVVKMQAMVRGHIARKKVQQRYGYSMTPGLLNRGLVHIEMDPVKLEAQR